MGITESKTMPHKELDEKAEVWKMTKEQAREKVGLKKCWAKDCDTGVDNIFGLCYEHLCEFVESIESLDKRMPEREFNWDFPDRKKLLELADCYFWETEMDKQIKPFNLFAEKYPELDKLATKLSQESIWPKNTFVQEIGSWLRSGMEKGEIEYFMSRIAEIASGHNLSFSMISQLILRDYIGQGRPLIKAPQTFT